MNRKGIIHFYGFQENPQPYYEAAHCVVLPSWHEGMSNVCLESAATGRPILVSDIPGCGETVIDGVSGYRFPHASKEALFETMERFHKLPYEEKVAMGEAGRTHMEKCFDRKEVVKAHMRAIKDIIG